MLRAAAILVGLALSMGLAPILTVAAQGTSSTYPSGLLDLTDQTMIIGAEDVVTIAAGTRVFGQGGHIEVWGSLTVNGSSNEPVTFGVPITVLPGGRLDATHARLVAVSTTAIEVQGGSVTLRDAHFNASTRALRASGPSRVHIENGTFLDHVGEAVYIEESGDVTIQNSSFRGNGRGITVYSAARFQLNDSDFAGNGQHLVVDLGPWSTPGEIVLSRDRFAPPAPTPAQLPGILLRHDPPLVDESAQRTVRLDSNRIEGAPVGLRAEGRGLIVTSRNDTFVDNGIGLSVQLATVRVEGGVFGNARDVDGSGRVSLDGVTYLRADGTTSAGVAAQPSWLLWVLGAGLVLLAAAAFLIPRLRAPRARTLVPQAPEPAPTPPPTPPPASSPADVGTLTSVERRIVEDVVAHPGTAQRAVADRLGMTRQALHYHVKKLEARGLVAKTVEGRETRCTVPAPVAGALAAAPVTRTGSEEKA